MTPAMIAVLSATMLGTAFLSGVFGMAGGLILMGVLLTILSVPEAMALHAVTQMASNGWRGVLWIRYIRWRAAGAFLLGSAFAFAFWTFWRYVPPKSLAFILLGVSPFLARLAPSGMRPDPLKLTHGVIYGCFCMMMMLLAGVSGPLVDTFFLGGKFDRREIIATKAACQIFSHLGKFAYFGGLVSAAGAIDPLMAAIAVATSIAGTSLARPVLERLSDIQYRWWANRIIAVVAASYVIQGAYLLMK